MPTDKLNRSLRDLRISVTDKCNFRCNYCMPEEVFGDSYKFLPRNQILSFEEIVRIARLYVKLGVRKIRITGGEPLLRQELEQLIKVLAGIDGVDDIAMTTNGYFLNKKLSLLHQAGLNRLTISLDTLIPQKFKQMAGQQLQHAQVLKSIDTALECGFHSIKLNCVVQRGVNDDEILALAHFAREKKLTMRFIEFMDVGTLNQWRMDKVVSAKTILDTIDQRFPAKAMAKNYPGEVANRFQYEDGAGEFGIIASVTNPFCGDCTRVRLSADGKIYTCLFSSDGLDVRPALRSQISDDSLLEILRKCWVKRSDRYSESRSEPSDEKTIKRVEMYHIGG